MGCHECEELRNAFNRVIENNQALLSEFKDAMMRRDHAGTDRLRLALLEIEEKRRDARIRLLAHEATHDNAFAVARA